MFSRDKPYPNLNPTQVATQVGKEELKPIPDLNWNKDVVDLINDCCRFNPNDRIQNFKEILDRLDSIEVSLLNLANEIPTKLKEKSNWEKGKIKKDEFEE